MAGTWAPAQSLQQVPAAAAEIASVLGSEELLDQHIVEVEAVADDMLARLDELSATLRTVTEDVQSQQVALEPAFRNITAGLARDFAYVDGVGDALVNMRVAVQRMEATITAAEANLWRQQREAEVQNGRRAVSDLLTKLKPKPQPQ